MHFEDSSLISYHSGPYDSDEWSCPLLAIGWLEDPQPYNKGKTSSEFRRKLQALVDASQPMYPQYYFRGMYNCSFCDKQEYSGIWSQQNIFVPGDGVVYLSPGGISHYVSDHSYKPPQSFIDAVLQCPDYGSAAYCDVLKEVNHVIDPPLKPKSNW